ncbi:HAUS augmin-like complex subunit 8 [Holothuria leucospilota]|uniref:HAUS augmin-like complex subunit 8 n=1 Tax=Holothuria leucospilota TaxID=206669 RepID=A0A9Q0YPJ7_HOLLE|nr:HAUS augmin-like complex subunit 8 [Holothuria leucospilota]
MSSKRSLYKPAPTSTVNAVGRKDARKPLIQGRLVNSPILPDTMTVFASPASHSYQSPSISRDSTVLSVAHEGSSLEGHWTPPRKAMASYSLTGSSPNTAAASELSPRRSPPSSASNAPSLVAPQSPPKPSPSRALDLSDSEQETSTRRTASKVHSRTKEHSVLMVDASGGRLDPRDTEVMVKTGMVQSPAKVICHTPSAVESDLRNTGSVQAAAQVSVDPVPSVSIMRSGNVETTEQTGKDTGGTVSGSDRKPRTPSSAKKLAYEDTEGSLESDVTDDASHSLALRDSVQVAEMSDNSQRARAEKERNPVPSKDKKKKTGRGGHIVPSRYMQSVSKTTAAASSTTSKTRSKSSTRVAPKVPKPTEKHMKKPPQKPSAASSAVRRTKQKKLQPPPAFSYTPMERGEGGKELFTSTPAMNGSFFPGGAPVNYSVIPGVSNISAIGPDISVMREDPTGALEGRFDDTKDESMISFSKQTPHPLYQKEITQFDLDKMYARYIQMVFLESKMRKQRQDEEKDAMLQLYLLHRENEDLSSKKYDLDVKLSRLKHAIALDQQLDVQKSGLGPVAAHLKQFQSEYSTLAHALDTTRHQISTTGIHLPQNEEAFQDDLLTSLAESEQILQGIGSTLQDKTTKTATFTKALQALDKAVEAEDKELQRCQRLLAKTSINTTYETSLKVQQIEGRLAE